MGVPATSAAHHAVQRREEVACSVDIATLPHSQHSCIHRPAAWSHCLGTDIKALTEDGHGWSQSLDVEEAFEARGASTELMLELARLEQQALNCVSGSSTHLPIQVRDTVHRFLQHLTRFVELPMQKWFELATLLDVYNLKSEDGNLMGSLPALCVALVMLVKKSDCSTVEVDAGHLLPHAAQLAEWLQKLGLKSVSTDLTEELVVREEMQVLDALGWRAVLPTVESWSAIFCARFDVLTRNQFQDSVTWIQQRSLAILHLIVMRQAASSEFPPKKIALGVFGLGLVAAKLLASDALRPPRISAADWDGLYGDGPLEGTVPQVSHSAEGKGCLLDVLVSATLCNLAEVQESCLMTAILVRDSLADMRAAAQSR